MRGSVVTGLFMASAAIVGAPIVLATLGVMPESMQAAGVIPGSALGLVAVLLPTPREKPEGYVGRYRRPDGSIVHVTRANGRLLVASDERHARDLGDATGPELLRWTLLGRSPDGDEGVAGAE